MAYRPIHLTLHRGELDLKERPSDLILLWNLGEAAQVNTGSEQIWLKKDDILSLSPYEPYELLARDGLLAAFALDEARMRSCFSGRHYWIQCNSARVVSDNYPPLRRLLGQVMQMLAERGPVSRG